MNRCTRKEDGICTHDAADRSRCANHRYWAGGVGDHLRRFRGNTAYEVKNNKFNRTKNILHIVTEDCEKPHIADKMEPASMHEHGREYRMNLAGRIVGELGGSERPAPDERIAAAEFEKKHGDVCDDENIGNDGNALPGAVVVADWIKHVRFLRLVVFFELR